MLANNFNPVSMDIPQTTIEVAARIRYNAELVKARLTYLGQDSIQFNFYEPQKAVTPGQSVVFYDGDVVLGGATIKQPLVA